jgi:lysophospholipase L1-like esterase
VRQLLQYHPVIGYTFVPEVRARVPHETGGYLVRANRTGFRCDREFTAERSPGMRRVLVFGDSFTAGDGVSNGQRYSDLLERDIPQVEVFNFGLPGSGTDQQYLAYREFSASIEHDLLIITVMVENIRRNVAAYRQYLDDTGKTVLFAKPYFTLNGDSLELHNVPPAKDPLPVEAIEGEPNETVDQGGRFAGLRKLIRATGLKDMAQRLTRYQPVPEYDSADQPAWRLTRRILDQWIRGHSTPVLVMPLPLYQFVEETSCPDAYRQRFRELAADTGCHLHDPLDDLRRYSMEERRAFRFPVDVHPTPAGHAAIASSLATAVRPLLPETV